MKKKFLTGIDILKKELQGDYNFFTKEANNNKKSKGYGLIRDKSAFAPEIASIASVGYGLAALAIGVERNWINYEKANERVEGTLDTFLNSLENINGFFYHFINMETAQREWNSEVSIIDTAIFICGAILAGEYFGGKVKEKAELLYKQINWNWYVDQQVNQFYMVYSIEKGFEGHWDMYAEQLILYILGVASPTYPINKILYDSFKKDKMDYLDEREIIYTYCGTLFTYQYSHAWVDFRKIKDKDGINWFENSRKATIANRAFCIKNSDKFKTYSKNSWGLTACVGSNGYSGGYGAMPALADLDNQNDGTVAPCGAIGSLVFTPDISINAVENYYNNFHKIWGKYGFKDAYNLEMEKPWFAKEYIGIDKGISMLMIENYLSGFIWKYFMKNKYVKKGLEILEFTQEEEFIAHAK